METENELLRLYIREAREHRELSDDLKTATDKELIDINIAIGKREYLLNYLSIVLKL